MNRILVICTDNVSRSPMAEGIIQKIIEENQMEGVTVQSAGLSASDGESSSDYAIEALHEIGIDISGHRSRRVVIEDLMKADCIYVMTPQHRDVILDAMPEISSKIIVMEISDPSGQELIRFRNCRDEMIAFFHKELSGG